MAEDVYNFKKAGSKMAVELKRSACVYNIKKDGNKMAAGVYIIRKDGNKMAELRN